MGNGAWNDNAFRAASTFRRARGIDDFAYTATLFNRPQAEWAADPTLDPFGVGMRESRDSVEHPNSTPIAVLFDVTGSMGAVPRIMQAKLGQLHGLLQRRGYLQDPQILFGGIGDADTDRVPLQVGQFESDNRMDEQLRTIFLEGNGGGQKSESYELATYFIARHTVTDAWEKRGRKGFLFIVGDEMNKPVLTAGKLRQVLGEPARGPVDVAGLYREVQQRWDTYFILPNQSHYFTDRQVREHWRALLGERLLLLDDPAAVCELIALTIGIREGAIDLNDGLADLQRVGSGHGRTVRKALAGMGTGRRAIAPFTIDPWDGR
ncbi:MAG: hypothetical protein ABWZ98_00885 [Nakamurella sp.]